MTDVIVVGTGITRFGKFPDVTVRGLAEEAVSLSLEDAGMAPTEVGMVFFANAAAGVISGQEMIRGQVALRHTGLLGKPIVNVENACASGSTAFHLAVCAVSSGQVDTAIVVGAEKITHPDKARSFAALGTAVDLDGVEALRQRVRRDHGGSQAPGSRSLFMDLYASAAQRYLKRTDATVEDFARVAVKSHAHASKNPIAQYRDLVTEAQVLASRPIVDPLTLLMCSPLGDGAAALCRHLETTSQVQPGANGSGPGDVPRLWNRSARGWRGR